VNVDDALLDEMYSDETYDYCLNLGVLPLSMTRDRWHREPDRIREFRKLPTEYQVAVREAKIKHEREVIYGRAES
jgi:hypothetical protein